MKKIIALCVGLTLFAACASELNVSEKSEPVNESRVLGPVGRYYTYVFTNGAEVSGYSDYLHLEKGKYEISVYFTHHFKEWIKQLDTAEIEYTSAPSSNPFKDQYIWISSELVLSVK